MKSIAFLLVMLGFCTLATAQDTVYLRKEAKKITFTDRPPQAFYVELGGAGVLLSANYDRRFNKQTDGLGYHGGIGYSFSNDVKFTTLPVGINYLAGDSHKGRFFEAGLNGTLIFVSSSSTSGDIYSAPTTTGAQTLFLTSVNLGYRSQPTTGGFNFRAGILPFSIEGITSVGLYSSFGFNF